MSSSVPSAIDQSVARLVVQMESGSAAAYQQAMADLANLAREGGPATLDAAIRALAPILPELGGDSARTAVLAGAIVEWGGSPLPLADGLPRRAAEAMMRNARVPELWERGAPGRPLPKPVGEGARELLPVLSALPPLSDDPQAVRQIAMAWSDMEDWLRPMVTLLGDARFRAAVPPDVRAELRRHAAAVGARSQLAVWVGRLAAVLDDEPLIVLDPATGRGYALTMGGVGDNQQLHILLADRLIGDPAQGLLPGERPSPRWVDAATAGNPRLALTNPAIRRFRLFDGHGSYVHPDGGPADIRPLDGTRVLILRPPNGAFGTNTGRVFAHLAPTLTLDRVLTQEEAAAWLARTAPPNGDDLTPR